MAHLQACGQVATIFLAAATISTGRTGKFSASPLAHAHPSPRGPTTRRQPTHHHRIKILAPAAAPAIPRTERDRETVLPAAKQLANWDEPERLSSTQPSPGRPAGPPPTPTACAGTGAWRDPRGAIYTRRPLPIARCSSLWLASVLIFTSCLVSS
ncbi:hypothetical protein GQ55_7G194000 [Panicum hallii var. hallii]|uniref:Uncharacterized protein n=1 Tax=Panicum hallii var. hallii TaxID=1504633 RepID=A0A2T7CWS1_9POAL|nr:hypothetical protein GQ55_7G194000 [Panicum hallii var. hallii]